MAWTTSNRKQRLPRNWIQLREACLKAANYRCQWVREDTSRRCGEYANQADHVRAMDDKSPLQALCEYHHSRKSSAEGGRAAAAARKAATKRHPGLLP